MRPAVLSVSGKGDENRLAVEEMESGGRGGAVSGVNGTGVSPGGIIEGTARTSRISVSQFRPKVPFPMKKEMGRFGN